MRAAISARLLESSTTLSQIFELISAQKSVPEFGQTKLRDAIKYVTGFSVICDLLLGVLSVAQTIQFSSTAMGIDVATYLDVLKRVQNARVSKMKSIQKGLTAYGAAVSGIFDASVEEFRAPLRMLSLYGPVAFSLENDAGERSGWLKKC